MGVRNAYARVEKLAGQGGGVLQSNKIGYAGKALALAMPSFFLYNEPGRCRAINTGTTGSKG